MKLDEERMNYLLDEAVVFWNALQELSSNADGSSTKSLSAEYISKFLDHVVARHDVPFDDCFCAAEEVTELNGELSADV